METSILITSGTTSKTQRSITHINPNATAEQLVNFAKSLNNLTNNPYDKTDRVQKINVDTEELPTQKTQATLNMKVDSQVITTISITTLRNDVLFSAETNSDARMVYFAITAPSGKNSGVISITPFGNDLSIQANNQTTSGCILHFTIPETATYTAATTTITITE